MITFLIVGLFLLATTGLLTWRAVTRAALGYEDATGFHYGEMTVAVRSGPSSSHNQAIVKCSSSNCDRTDEIRM